jgi:hypothetical protein
VPPCPGEDGEVVMAMFQGTFVTMSLGGGRAKRDPRRISHALLDVFFRGIDAK